MAAGSQLENGICALFVMAAKVIHKICKVVIDDSHIFMISQWPWFRVHPIDTNRSTSPTRFVNAVIIPAAKDLGFW